MNICFVLPRFTRRPIGGYKIVFEYANRFSEIGHKVTLLFINNNNFVEYKVPGFMGNFCSDIMTKIEPRWFPLRKDISKISRICNIKSKATTIDVCIATGAETVAICKRLFHNAQKCYLIQGFETWVMSENDLYDTYSAGFKNIVVSSWLEKIVNFHSDERCVLINNPIDLSIYRPIKSLKDREKYTIGLLYHTNEQKGLEYSIETLSILEKKYKDLKVYMFGTSKPKEKIPGLVKFIRDASQTETVDIYNKVSVFMCSTISEGYGLTPMEAMACGAVVASTNYDGIHEYGLDGINCLLSPVKDPVAMAENISRLFEDDELRYSLSFNGTESLRTFDWKVAVEKFLKIMES